MSVMILFSKLTLFCDLFVYLELLAGRVGAGLHAGIREFERILHC